MNFEQIKSQIELYKNQSKRIFTTSSFQTQSVVLLHIISKIDNSIPVYFINTGFLFPETIEYKEKLISLLKLNVITVNPLIPKNLQKDQSGKLLFSSDPDSCCYINKIQPLELVLADNDVWINGIRAAQSETRKQMNIEELAPHHVTRFHPMLDWTNEMISEYITENKLPVHPLDKLGYVSVGCEPCTRKVNLTGDERLGRWFGMKKTECGLHTDLVIKNSEK